VVAEGIEDEATLQAVRRLGCDQAQGYHIGRPQPPAALAEQLRSAALAA
jgi:EAL domain-containing protein (putative c-di-GMP-specific phosphodiesterase class I)